MPEQEGLVERNAELAVFPDSCPLIPGEERGWCRAVKNAIGGDEPRDGGCKIGDLRLCLERNRLEDASHLILQTDRTQFEDVKIVIIGCAIRQGSAEFPGFL